MQFGAQVSCYRSIRGRLVQPGDTPLQWSDIRGVVETMEAGRWNSVWFADHFVPPPGPREDEPLPAFEGLSVVAAVAGLTQRLQMGHLVIGNTYRNPGLVAKMAGTITAISGGRVTMGIGASWFEREHAAYGWDFPPMRERQDRLQEACGLLRRLLRDADPIDHQGDYYRLTEAPLSPGREGAPIPILVGGTGEKRTLKTLAMHGDIFNLDGWAGAGMSLDLYKHKLSVLEKHCENVGRDPAEIRRTILMPAILTDDAGEAADWVERVGPGTLAGGASELVDRLAEFIEFGVDEIMFGGMNVEPEDFIRFDEDVLSAFD